MKKRLLSFLLCLVMVAGLFPAAAIPAAAASYTSPYDPSGDYFEVVLRAGTPQDTSTYKWTGSELEFKKSCTIGPVYIDNGSSGCTVDLGGYTVTVRTDRGHCGFFLKGGELLIKHGGLNIEMNTSDSRSYGGFNTFGICAPSLLTSNFNLSITGASCGIHSGSVDFHEAAKLEISSERSGSVGILTGSFSSDAYYRSQVVNTKITVSTKSYALYLTGFGYGPLGSLLFHMTGSFVSADERFAVYQDNPSCYIKASLEKGTVLSFRGGAADGNRAGCNVPIILDNKAELVIEHESEYETVLTSVQRQGDATSYSGSYPLTIRANNGIPVKLNLNALSSGQTQTFDGNPGISVRKSTDSTVDVALNGYNGGPIMLMNPGQNTTYNFVLSGSNIVMSDPHFGDTGFYDIDDAYLGGIHLENAASVKITKAYAYQGTPSLSVSFDPAEYALFNQVSNIGLYAENRTSAYGSAPQVEIEAGTVFSVHLPDSSFVSRVGRAAGISTVLKGSYDQTDGTVKVSGVLDIDICAPSKQVGTACGIETGNVVAAGTVSISISDSKDEERRRDSDYRYEYYNGIYCADYRVTRDVNSVTVSVPCDGGTDVRGVTICSVEPKDLSALSAAPAISYKQSEALSQDGALVYSFLAGSSSRLTSGITINGRHYSGNDLQAGALNGPGWTWTPAGSVLTLSNYNGDYIAVDPDDAESQNLTILLRGSSTINSSRGYGIIGNIGYAGGRLSVTTDKGSPGMLTINVQHADTERRIGENNTLCGITVGSHGRLDFENQANVRIFLTQRDEGSGNPYPYGIYTKSYNIFDDASLSISVSAASGYTPANNGYAIAGKGMLFTSGDVTLDTVGTKVYRNIRQNTNDSLEVQRVGRLRSVAYSDACASVNAEKVTFSENRYGAYLDSETHTYTISPAYALYTVRSDKYSVEAAGFYSEESGNYKIFLVPVNAKIGLKVTVNEGYIKGSDFGATVTTAIGTRRIVDTLSPEGGTIWWRRDMTETGSSSLVISGVREESLFVSGAQRDHTYLMPAAGVNSYPAYVELELNAEEYKYTNGYITVERFTDGSWTRYATLSSPRSGTVLLSLTRENGEFRDYRYRFSGTVKNPETKISTTYYSDAFTLGFTSDPAQADTVHKVNIYVDGQNGGAPFTLDKDHLYLNRLATGAYSVSNDGSISAASRPAARFYPDCSLLLLFEGELRGRIEVPSGCVGTLNVAVNHSSGSDGTHIYSGKYPAITNLHGDINICGNRFVSEFGMLRIDVDTGSETEAANSISNTGVTAGILASGNIYIGDYSNVPTDMIQGDWNGYDELGLQVHVNNKIAGADAYGILSYYSATRGYRAVELSSGTRAGITVSNSGGKAFGIKCGKYYQNVSDSYHYLNITLNAADRTGISVHPETHSLGLDAYAVVEGGRLSIKESEDIAALPAGGRGQFTPLTTDGPTSWNLAGSSRTEITGHSDKTGGNQQVIPVTLNLRGSAELRAVLDCWNDTNLCFASWIDCSSAAQIPLDIDIRNSCPGVTSGIGWSNVTLHDGGPEGQQAVFKYSSTADLSAYISAPDFYLRRSLSEEADGKYLYTDTYTHSKAYLVTLRDAAGGLTEEKGQVIGGSLSYEAYYEPGDTVYIRPPEENAVYSFSHWNTTLENAPQIMCVETGTYAGWYRFTMPASDITLQAVFGSDIIRDAAFTRTGEGSAEFSWSVKDGYTLSESRMQDFDGWRSYYELSNVFGDYSNPSGDPARHLLVRYFDSSLYGYYVSDGDTIRMAATATDNLTNESFPVYSDNVTVDWGLLCLTGTPCGSIGETQIGDSRNLHFGDTFIGSDKDYSFSVEASAAMSRNGFSFFRDGDDWVLRFTARAVADAEDCFIAVSGGPGDSVRIPVHIGRVSSASVISEDDMYDLKICGIQVTANNRNDLASVLSGIDAITECNPWGGAPSVSFEPTDWNDWDAIAWTYDDGNVRFVLEKHDSEAILEWNGQPVRYYEKDGKTIFYFKLYDYDEDLNKNGPAPGSEADLADDGCLLVTYEGPFSDLDFSNGNWSCSKIVYRHEVTEGILHLSNVGLRMKGSDTPAALIESGLEKKLIIETEYDSELDYSGCGMTDGDNSEATHYGILCSADLEFRSGTCSQLRIWGGNEADCLYARDISCSNYYRTCTVADGAYLRCEGRFDFPYLQVDGTLYVCTAAIIDSIATVNGTLDASDAYLCAGRYDMTGGRLFAGVLDWSGSGSPYYLNLSGRASAEIRNTQYSTGTYDPDNNPCFGMGIFGSHESLPVSTDGSYYVAAERSLNTDGTGIETVAAWVQETSLPAKDAESRPYLYYSIRYNDEAAQTDPYVLNIGGSTYSLAAAEAFGFCPSHYAYAELDMSGTPEDWEIFLPDIRADNYYQETSTDFDLKESGGELWLRLCGYSSGDITLEYRGDGTPMPLNIVVEGANKVFGGIRYSGGTLRFWDSSKGTPVEMLYPKDDYWSDTYTASELVALGISADKVPFFQADELMITQDIDVTGQLLYSSNYYGIDAESVDIKGGKFIYALALKGGTDDYYGGLNCGAIRANEGGLRISGAELDINISDSLDLPYVYLYGLESYGELSVTDSQLSADMTALNEPPQMHAVSSYGEEALSVSGSVLELGLHGETDLAYGLHSGSGAVISDSVLSVAAEDGAGINASSKLHILGESKIDINARNAVSFYGSELKIDLAGAGYVDCTQPVKSCALSAWEEIDLGENTGVLTGMLYGSAIYSDDTGRTRIVVKSPVDQLALRIPAGFRLAAGMNVTDICDEYLWSEDPAGSRIRVEGFDSIGSKTYENVAGISYLSIGFYYGNYLWYCVDDGPDEVPLDSWWNEFEEGKTYQLAIRVPAAGAFCFADSIGKISDAGTHASVKYVEGSNGTLVEIRSDYFVAGPKEVKLSAYALSDTVFVTVSGMPASEVWDHAFYTASYDENGRMTAFKVQRGCNNGECSMDLPFEYKTGYSYLITILKETDGSYAPVCESVKLVR